MELKNLTLELTNRCNLRCRMCTIWAEKNKESLSMASICNLIESDALKGSFSVSLTGGECYVYPEIQELLLYLYEKQQEGRVSHVSVVSNGYATERTKQVLDMMPDELPGWEFDFSVDGMQENHEDQRGVAGSYERTLKSMRYVRNRYPDNDVILKLTINKYNYVDTLDVYEHCKREGFQFLPKLIEDGAKNYYQRLETNDDIFGFPDNIKVQIIEVLKELLHKGMEDMPKIISPKDLIKYIKYLQGGLCISKCRTPKHTLFVTSKGGIHPCLYYDPIGNLKEDWERKLLDINHKKIVVEGYKGTCPRCIAYHGYLRSIND